MWRKVCISNLEANTAICSSHMLREFVLCLSEAKLMYLFSKIKETFGASPDWLPAEIVPLLIGAWAASVLSFSSGPSFHTSVAECIQQPVPDRAPSGTGVGWASIGLFHGYLRKRHSFGLLVSNTGYIVTNELRSGCFQRAGRHSVVF